MITALGSMTEISKKNLLVKKEMRQVMTTAIAKKTFLEKYMRSVLTRIIAKKNLLVKNECVRF